MAMSDRRWGKRCWISVLWSLALLWLVGCGGVPSQPTHLEESAGTTVATLILIPDPPVPMQDTALELRLQDGGQPVIGATVAMTLTMPGCSMPPSHLTFQEKDNGLYRAQTVLTMAGAWQADASITFSSEQDTQFTFLFATK